VARGLRQCGSLLPPPALKLTGAGLVVAPSLLARLLFGSEMNASGDLVGRISGLVMLCLALGCWPRAFEGEDRRALAPLIALSLLATVYLIYVGIGGANVGVLLWPAAAAHLIRQSGTSM
jgi:hypothetical protein